MCGSYVIGLGSCSCDDKGLGLSGCDVMGLGSLGCFVGQGLHIFVICLEPRGNDVKGLGWYERP